MLPSLHSLGDTTLSRRWVVSESTLVRSTISIASSVLGPMNGIVNSARSLGSILSVSSLQVDEGGVVSEPRWARPFALSSELDASASVPI